MPPWAPDLDRFARERFKGRPAGEVTKLRRRMAPTGPFTDPDDLAAELDRYVRHRGKEGRLEVTGWPGRPLLDTPLPCSPEAPAWFSWHRVDRVLWAGLNTRQIVGEWAGSPLKYLDTQVRYVLAPVFGIVSGNDHRARRIIRTAWVEVPRKNGKSTLATGLALYLLELDDEPGAQVVAAAGDRTQARLVFDPCRDMARTSPAWELWLDGANGIKQHQLTSSTLGWLRALSSDGARQHGLNIHGALIDEVHVHKNHELIEALETGTGARRQPLVVFITTADEGRDGSIYATKREYLENLVAGNAHDPTWRGVVFGAPKDVADTPAEFELDTLIGANPGIGYTVQPDYLEAKAAAARQSPTELNGYRRLHLNIRTRQADRWLPVDRWDHGAIELPADAFAGAELYGGLDLSSSTDFTAFAFMAPIPTDQPDDVDQADELDDDGNELEVVRRAGGYYVHVLHWLPEDRLDELATKTGVDLEAWAADGWLRLTEGTVVDYRKVRDDILSEADVLGADLAGREVGFDPWNASETQQELAEAGVTMVATRQGYATLSRPCKELERLVMGSTAEAPLIVHGGNPVLRWCVDNVAVRQDEGGNLKPTKPDRHKSGKRIDGVAATLNALSRAMLRTPPPKPRRAAGF